MDERCFEVRGILEVLHDSEVIAVLNAGGTVLNFDQSYSTMFPIISFDWSNMKTHSKMLLETRYGEGHLRLVPTNVGML